MTKISEKIMEEYKQLVDEKLDLLEEVEKSEPVKETITLILEYQTYKELLITREKEYDTALVMYDTELTVQKQKYLDDGLKSTEAKEKAKMDLVDKNIELLDIESDVKFLKACIHSMEYMLRLKFIQMQKKEDCCCD